MTPNSWAGLITAGATMLTAIGGIVLAFAAIIPMWRTTRLTHKIVNQQRTDMLKYQAVLIRALKSAGIDVPDDQSQEEVG